MPTEREWLVALSSAARSSAPLVFIVRVRGNREAHVRGRVAELGSDWCTVVAPRRPRFTVVLADLIDVRRPDGRPWRALIGNAPDARAELRDTADAHQAGGGLE